MVGIFLQDIALVAILFNGAIVHAIAEYSGGTHSLALSNRFALQ